MQGLKKSGGVLGVQNFVKDENLFIIVITLGANAYPHLHFQTVALVGSSGNRRTVNISCPTATLSG